MGKTACFFSWKCFRWREGLLRKSGVSWGFWVYPCLLFGKESKLFFTFLWDLRYFFFKLNLIQCSAKKVCQTMSICFPAVFFPHFFLFFGKGAASTQNATYWFAFLRQLWHAMAGLWYQIRENLDMIPSFLKRHISSQMETKVSPSSLGGGGPKGLFATVFGAFFLTCGCEFHEELQGGEGNFLTSWRSFWVIRVKCKNRAAYKVGPDAPVIRELWSPEINGRALNGFLPGVISPYWKGPHFSPFITGLNLPTLWDWRIKAKLPDEEGGKIELQDGVSSVFVKL